MQHSTTDENLFQLDFSLIFVNDTSSNTFQLSETCMCICHFRNRLTTFLICIEYDIKYLDQFNYFILYLYSKVCDELNDGRIAILVIGESTTFFHLHGIASSLNIPFISIRWDNWIEEESFVESTLMKNFLTINDDGGGDDNYNDDNSNNNSNNGQTELIEYESNNYVSFKAAAAAAEAIVEERRSTINHINLHPPGKQLTNAIINLIDHYKWEYVTLIYHENSGLRRIEDLLRFERKKIFSNQRISLDKLNIQVRQLSSNVDQWVYLLKDIKQSGSCHLIVDIQVEYLNRFFESVYIILLLLSSEEYYLYYSF